MVTQLRDMLAEKETSNLIKGGTRALVFFIVVILIVFLFDFTKLRKQNETIIEQNEKVISLLEEIKNK